MSNDLFLNDAIVMKYELKEYSVWWFVKACHVIESLLHSYITISSSNIMTHAAGPTLTQLGLHLKFRMGCNRSNVYFRFSHSNASSTCLNKCQSWWRHQTKSFSAWGEPTRRKLDSPTKASDAKLWCFCWCASKQTFEQTVEMPFILTNKWKTKGLGRPPKMHYFSAFSVRRLGDGLLGVTKGNHVFFSVNTLWVNIAESLTDVNDITYVQNCKPLDCPISYIAPFGQA